MLTLARDFGYLKPSDALRHLTARELKDWAMLYTEDTEGRRADRRAAIIAHTVYQMAGGRSRTLDSFMAVDRGRDDRLAALKLALKKGARRGQD